MTRDDPWWPRSSWAKRFRCLDSRRSLTSEDHRLTFWLHFHIFISCGASAHSRVKVELIDSGRKVEHSSNQRWVLWVYFLCYSWTDRHTAVHRTLTMTLTHMLVSKVIKHTIPYSPHSFSLSTCSHNFRLDLASRLCSFIMNFDCMKWAVRLNRLAIPCKFGVHISSYVYRI